MPLRTGHAAQRVGEATTNSENRNQLDEVRQWSWVLKRVSAVGVEKSAAICAQFLDDFLGCNRTLGNGLRGHCIHYRLALRIEYRLAVRRCFLYLHGLDELHGVVGFEILNHALRNQHESADDAGGQKHPKIAANQIHPEVAEGLRLPPRN